MPRFWPRRDTPTTEAATTAPARVVAPTGYAFGIPAGGTTEYNQGTTAANDTDRRSLLEELYQSYLTCPWSSACVDVVARTITAGGLEVVWDGHEDEAPDAPPQAEALRDLLGFVNPMEDIRQLLRGVLSDLMVFGDAFLEVVWLGDTPVALYSLDVPSMSIIADEHGTVTGFVQLTDTHQRATFEPREVIHISLDNPRSGLTGVSPTQKVLLPITVWLFTAATLKEVMRKGDPPNIHVDFPASESDESIKKWRAQYAVRNLGPRNIGTPITTKGSATVKELKSYAVDEYLKTLDQKRDEILSGYGVPPAKVGVIESGNLGGGTGTTQDKSFRVNTCGPIGAAVLEKLNFALLRAFGVPDGWTMRFAEMDWRDDKTVDDIAMQRLRDGRWTLNRARAEIGEPPVDGGDDAVLVLSRQVVIWDDVEQMSHNLAQGMPAGGVVPAIGAPVAPQPAPVPAVGGAGGGKARESVRADASEAWQQRYAAELARVRAELVDRGRD